MTQINLLPWREQGRQIKKMRFMVALIASVLGSLCIILIFHIYLSGLVGEQQQLNDVLQEAINKEQAVLNDMSSKEDEKATVDAQLQFIINLYSNSFRAVRLLNELVTLVPSSVSLNRIVRNGDTISLAGIANSENDITLFMQDIGRSPYFNQPVLSEIYQDKNSRTENTRYFQLNFKQKG